MKARRAPASLRQRGVAAIELALILPILLGMLAFPLFYGRVFWHYTVAAKAAHDAARYLAAVPVVDMTTSARTANALEVVQLIFAAEISDLNPGPSPPIATPMCNVSACNGYSLPTTVSVKVEIPMHDMFFTDITWEAVGFRGLILQADVAMPYVGQ